MPYGLTPAELFARRFASYAAPLTHTLIPLVGSAPTFSRTSSTSNGTVRDVYGAVQICSASEARFQGARRVRNLVADSEALSSGWTTGATSTKSSVTASVNPLTPKRRNMVSYVRTLGDGTNHLTRNSTAYRVTPHVVSLCVDGDRTAQIRVRIERSSDSAQVQQYDVTPAAGVHRYAFPFTPLDATNHRIIFTTNSTSQTTIVVGTIQVEETWLGSAICGDYVSVGVESSPYFGANVDGVQYFNTHNPWRYVSGTSGRVVADYDPSYIPEHLLKGIMVEPLASNKFLQNNTLSNAAWTKTGCTLGAAADSSYGPSTLTKVVEDTSTGNHGVSNVWAAATSTPTDANTSTCASFTVKAAERTWCCIKIDMGGTIGSAYFNLTDGTVGTVTGTNAAAFIAADGDAWRVSLAVDAGASYASYAGTAFAALYTATGDGVVSFTGSASSGLYVGAAQWEMNECPTSYVGDQTNSATFRNADVLSVSTTNVLAGATAWTVTLDCTANHRTDHASKASWLYAWYAYTDGTNRFGLSMRPGAKGGQPAANVDDWAGDYYPNSASWDGQDISLALTAGQTVRTVMSVGPTAVESTSGVGLLVNGHAAAVASAATKTTTFTLSSIPSAIYIGNERSGTSPRHSMAYKNFCVIPRQMTDAQMSAIDLTYTPEG